ncbi:uncharacterized protein LOC114305232, partial [Camellia sinensis]|uniref:uncharacterized protein LOC114305232 n=1 Tax=Camellia sinensis TaxID=4442 RepID=UPI001035F463
LGLDVQQHSLPDVEIVGIMCILENFSTVTIILLGKLGRLGVDANGYGNKGVENLKSRLSAFLCQSSSRKLGMPSQIATVNALLGLLPLNFEEIIKCSVAELLPAAISQSDPADNFEMLTKYNTCQTIFIAQSEQHKGNQEYTQTNC